MRPNFSGRHCTKTKFDFLTVVHVGKTIFVQEMRLKLSENSVIKVNLGVKISKATLRANYNPKDKFVTKTILEKTIITFFCAMKSQFVCH
jgi:hypothetical protein